MKKGFTLIELIFAIVIIGVLAAVAVPQFGKLKTSAEISNVADAINTIHRTAKSVYYNETELMNTTATDLTIGDFLKPEGNGWTENGDDYVYTGEAFSATFSFSNPNVTINLTDVTSGGADEAATALTERTPYDFSEGENNISLTGLFD